MKRYRRPKVNSDEIKFQRGKHDGIYDNLVYYGDDIPKCDINLIMQWFCSENLNYTGGDYPSFIQELEKRGYDLDSLRFYVKKKEA